MLRLVSAMGRGGVQDLHWGGGGLEQETRMMSRLHLPGLYLSVWEEDRLKDGLVNRQLY